MNGLEEGREARAELNETLASRPIPRRDFFIKSFVVGMGVMGLSVLEKLPVAAAGEEAAGLMATAKKLHVCGLATDGTIWHTIRFANGTWQPDFGNVNNQEGNGGSLSFTELDCAGIDGNLHVTAVAQDGTIWHTIRFAKGTWQSNFGNVNNQEGNGRSLSFTSVGCVGIGNDLHVTAVASDGTIWHTIRFANGTWQPNFGNVNNQEGNGGSLSFTDVDCANVASNLHVTAVAQDGTIWHTIRFANGTWQPNFGNVNNQEGNGGSLSFTSVGCAGIVGNLHVTAVAQDGTIWHTIRFANGTWQPNFGNVNNQEGNGGSLSFTGVGAGGVM